MSVRSAYIHIPFCKSKCNYCSFVSFKNQDKKSGYLYSLLKEIDYYYNGENLDTLYIGGGTPSLLSAEELGKLYNKFNLSDNTEKTVELNPNDINDDYAKKLYDIGFNRVSLGAQSFDDDILKIIGRRHCVQEIYNAVNCLKKAGFENINIDLIYGLPNQTIENFRHDIEEVIKLDIPHVSMYGLKIEEGCYFYKNRPNNLPDDDFQADMYIMACDMMKKNGFEHYEVSNFAKPNYQSKHNKNYWKCGGYYGFGVSAHGYVDGIRYSNYSTLEDYMDSPTSHEIGKFLTKQEMLEESIFLGFRLSEGIDISKINSNFDIDFETKYKKILDKYLMTGHIEKTLNGYRLSDNKDHSGFLLSNVILSEFLD